MKLPSAGSLRDSQSYLLHMRPPIMQSKLVRITPVLEGCSRCTDRVVTITEYLVENGLRQTTGQERCVINYQCQLTRRWAMLKPFEVLGRAKFQPNKHVKKVLWHVHINPGRRRIYLPGLKLRASCFKSMAASAPYPLTPWLFSTSTRILA
jgi:hypothetical protein